MLVLTAAILHASWNAMAKSGGLPEYSIASYQLVGALICALLIGFVPFPTAQAWPYILLSVFIHNLYYFSLARCYRSGDLSLVYPLFRGLAPVLVAIGAGWFAGEWLSRPALVGVFLVSFGLIVLVVMGGAQGRPSKNMVKWGLITSVFISIYTVVDGLGVRTVDNSLSYILWLFALEFLPICGWLYWTQWAKWRDYMRANKGKIIAGGVASSLAYALVIYAMSLGAMALVSSLRETSVIFATIIGALWLKEPFGRQRITAASFVVLGVMVIKYYGQ